MPIYDLFELNAGASVNEGNEGEEYYFAMGALRERGKKLPIPVKKEKQQNPQKINPRRKLKMRKPPPSTKAQATRKNL